MAQLTDHSNDKNKAPNDLVETPTDNVTRLAQPTETATTANIPSRPVTVCDLTVLGDVYHIYMLDVPHFIFLDSSNSVSKILFWS